MIPRSSYLNYSRVINRREHPTPPEPKVPENNKTPALPAPGSSQR